jgi:hypothetical protein
MSHVLDRLLLLAERSQVKYKKECHALHRVLEGRSHMLRAILMVVVALSAALVIAQFGGATAQTCADACTKAYAACSRSCKSTDTDCFTRCINERESCLAKCQ